LLIVIDVHGDLATADVTQKTVRMQRLVYLKVDHVWDSLRTGPRFQELLKRMRLVVSTEDQGEGL